MFGFRSARSPAMEQRHHALDQTSTVAVREINRNAAAQFDPRVVEASLPANGIGLIRDNAFQPQENEERWPTNC
jgi:HD-GYP domain-containing protein (c-di-GMP phosphodiesterase class II)